VREDEGFQASEEALLDEARRRTGLSELGGGPWRDGLRVLLRAYDEEARFTPQARGRVRDDLVNVLCARLGVEEGWRREPACLEARIERPIFVLGLPRTGTTALHFLLARDPANQVLEYWLASNPRPRPPRDTWEREPDFQRAVEGLRQMYAQDPDLKAIHLMEADGPEECRHLLMQSFLDDTFDSNATVPSYTKWFHAQDPRPAYARHRDILKLVGSPAPERRWVLKYPAHLRNLDTVLETHPDACFIWTHRDPARVLPSLCSLVAGWRLLYEGEVDAAAIGRWQLDMWSGLVAAGVEKRRAMDPARFFDLPFAELLRDPVAALRRAYAHFGLELSAQAERRMAAWHAAHPQGRHGSHRYSAEQFGLGEAEIDERFAAYRDAFDVAREPGSDS
jgi:hypothetical protein